MALFITYEITTIKGRQWNRLDYLDMPKNSLSSEVPPKKKLIVTIRTASWQQAESGRLECKKDFPFENEWNKKYYKIKQVRPIFVEEETEIVVVTVYTYFC